jgi:hypothetical protein
VCLICRAAESSAKHPRSKTFSGSGVSFTAGSPLISFTRIRFGMGSRWCFQLKLKSLLLAHWQKVVSENTGQYKLKSFFISTSSATLQASWHARLIPMMHRDSNPGIRQNLKIAVSFPLFGA